jgi:hypothetical protein
MDTVALTLLVLCCGLFSPSLCHSASRNSLSSAETSPPVEVEEAPPRARRAASLSLCPPPAPPCRVAHAQSPSFRTGVSVSYILPRLGSERGCCCCGGEEGQPRGGEPRLLQHQYERRNCRYAHCCRRSAQRCIVSAARKSVAVRVCVGAISEGHKAQRRTSVVITLVRHCCASCLALSRRTARRRLRSSLRRAPSVLAKSRSHAGSEFKPRRQLNRLLLSERSFDAEPRHG